MIGLGFTVLTLVLACLCISLVYALISGQHPSRFPREILMGFALMVGGVLALALVIELLPVIFKSG
ncbi:MAG: hypothetical protein HY814_15010 [Candidatus Riflebacteria bacterium]|nr:hypothetical protein [Candidatus Riflebacteria bacterium]